LKLWSNFLFPPTLFSLFTSLSTKWRLLNENLIEALYNKPNFIISHYVLLLLLLKEGSEVKFRTKNNKGKVLTLSLSLSLLITLWKAHLFSMAKSKNNAKKLSYISVPSQIINSISSSSLQSLLDSPKKTSRSTNRFFFFFTNTIFRRPRLWFFTLFLFGFLGMLKFALTLNIPFSPYPCATTLPQNTISTPLSKSNVGVLRDNNIKDEVLLTKALVSHVELRAQGLDKVEGDGGVEKSEFWKQPDGLGYKPCLSFSRDYRRATDGVLKDRRKYLMVVVSGGLNQQRNQIVDAVVIARILGAALVVPILQVNVIWGDERYILFLSIVIRV